MVQLVRNIVKVNIIFHVNFNSTMVQLVQLGDCVVDTVNNNFNSTMVQLVQVLRQNLSNSLHYFNSTMVQLVQRKS